VANGYIIAHDVGTTDAKAVLIQPDGRPIGRARASYAVHYPRPGWAEQEPDDWWTALCRTTRQLLTECAVRPDQVIGLTASTQLLGVVPVDAASQALHRAIIWLDARAQTEADRLMRKLLGPRVFALIAGETASGKDVAPKLLWLQQHAPAIFKAAHVFLDVQGYLVARATGRQLIDWTAASATGLFDLRHKQWHTLLIRVCGLSIAKLPPLCRPGAIVGGLQQRAADELGLRAGTPVICGAGDVPIAAVGAGATREGAAHIYLGTSGWVGVSTRTARRNPRGVATLQAADPQMLLRFAETETAGACAAWLQQTLFQDSFAAIDAAIERVRPGAERLLFTPWLYGERAPVRDVFARAAFVNLGPQHTRGHMARAVYEGVAYNLRWILDLVQQNNDYRQEALRIIGGGAQSDSWMQIIADVTGRCIERVAAPREAGAIGAALLAAKALRAPAADQPHAAVEVERVFRPQREHAPVYDELYAVYQRLYPALKPIYRQLNQRGAAEASDAQP
jgi:xylulokinase